ncbi:MAG: hypothetical protein II719_00355, partial [Clostridia bacterium]|nr:hypothetical protein [Clostridia bacterium]
DGNAQRQENDGYRQAHNIGYLPGFPHSAGGFPTSLHYNGTAGEKQPFARMSQQKRTARAADPHKEPEYGSVF